MRHWLFLKVKWHHPIELAKIDWYVLIHKYIKSTSEKTGPRTHPTPDQRMVHCPQLDLIKGEHLTRWLPHCPIIWPIISVCQETKELTGFSSIFTADWHSLPGMAIQQSIHFFPSGSDPAFHPQGPVVPASYLLQFPQLCSVSMQLFSTLRPTSSTLWTWNTSSLASYIQQLSNPVYTYLNSEMTLYNSTSSLPPFYGHFVS